MFSQNLLRCRVPVWGGVGCCYIIECLGMLSCSRLLSASVYDVFAAQCLHDCAFSYSFEAHHFWEFCDGSFLIVLARPCSNFASLSAKILPWSRLLLHFGMLISQSRPSVVVGFKQIIF